MVSKSAVCVAKTTDGARRNTRFAEQRIVSRKADLSHPRSRKNGLRTRTAIIALNGCYARCVGASVRDSKDGLNRETRPRFRTALQDSENFTTKNGRTSGTTSECVQRECCHEGTCFLASPCTEINIAKSPSAVKPKVRARRVYSQLFYALRRSGRWGRPIANRRLGAGPASGAARARVFPWFSWVFTRFASFGTRVDARWHVLFRG